MPETSMRTLVRGPAVALAVLGVVLPASGPARARDLPRQVQAEIDADIRECRPEKVVLGRGFVSQRDVNGDGTPDFILDYGAFQCGDRAAFYCGSGGCTTKVFVSTGRNGYAKVFDEIVRGMQFRTVNGRPAMMLNLHGSACGKVGAEPCGKTLTWNGTRFASAR
jgi:hypothetical protein